MRIPETKLIQGLVDNVEALSALCKDASAQSLLKSSQVMLHELQRRENHAGIAQVYGQGRSLLVDASAFYDHAGPRAALQAALQMLPEQFPAHFDASYAHEQMQRLHLAIDGLVRGTGFPNAAHATLQPTIRALIDWELERYRLPTRSTVPRMHSEVSPTRTDARPPVKIDAEILEHYLTSHWPGYENARVVACNAIAGGFSKSTLLFDVKIEDRLEQWVYRGTTHIQSLEPILVDIADEFHVVAYAFAHGAPVAEPRWLQADRAATGTRFFISRRANGSNLGTAAQAHETISPEATRSLAQALAKIHGLSLHADSALQHSHIRAPRSDETLPGVIRARITRWQAHWLSLHGDAHPVLELAFRWLLNNIAAAEEDVPVLVHGDYGLHNILIHEDRVTAVLDWEACFVGDRALDLSHLLTGTAGKMDQGAFMDAYIEAGGQPVSQFRLKYYQVLMNMQFMLSTLDAQHLFENRAGAGTQFCTLGLGFIHHAASSLVNGILQSDAIKRA